ncbi:hypothetical protein [Halomonas pantelleriensis]
MSADITERVSLHATYDGSLADDFADHRGQAGVTFTW